ncbi:MAG: class II aldolase/adducin family protein [Candidatus Thermoplasmatota archaeon]|jgi:L-fuculose-phosphate aldolase|nr:class II aldolase/adducin family protein [Candidatus Thermoplasmatota archaeon]
MMPKKEYINIIHKLAEKNFFPGTSGNISVRINKRQIKITQTHIFKDTLTVNDFATVSINNKKIDVNSKMRPSSETRMHIEIYRSRPDISVIIHAHPIYTTYFAVSNILPDVSILPETEKQIGKLSMVNYYPSGSEKLAIAAGKASIGSNALILRNHGAVTMGSTFEDTAIIMEMLEYLCNISYIKLLTDTLASLKNNNSED